MAPNGRQTAGPRWLEERGKSKKAPLSPEEIVDAALALIDEEGLAAFSMRKLADRLGAFTTSLYWHVGNRDELLVAVADAALSQVPLPPAGRKSWKQYLRDVAAAFRTTIHAHPHLAPLVAGMITVTPSSLVAAENVLGALSRAGFKGQQLVDAYNAVVGYIVGFTTVEMSPPPAEVSPTWDEAIETYLDELDAEELPFVTGNRKLLANHAFGLRWKGWQEASLERSFDVGFSALLDGLEGLAKRKG